MLRKMKLALCPKKSDAQVSKSIETPQKKVILITFQESKLNLTHFFRLIYRTNFFIFCLVREASFVVWKLCQSKWMSYYYLKPK